MTSTRINDEGSQWSTRDKIEEDNGDEESTFKERTFSGESIDT